MSKLRQRRQPSRISLLALGMCLANVGSSRDMTYRAPMSALDMIPSIREAAQDFLSQRQAGTSKRRLQATEDDEEIVDEDVDQDVEFTDDADEEIIDPSEDMPDSWTQDDEEDFENQMDPIAKDEASECVSVLMDITNNFMSYNDTVMHIFRNSGKDYNDFGRYEDCQQIHNFNYFMVTVLKKFPIPFTMGLCLPEQCQLADLDEFKPFLTKAINGALPNMFEGVKGFDVTPTVSESDVQFVDPKIENEKVTRLELVSIIACTVIAFFVLMTVIGTFLLWSKAKDALKLQRNRLAADQSSPSENRRSNTSSFASSGSGNGPQSDDTSCTKFLRCFSVMDNLSKLSKPLAKQGDQELEVLNGLRVIFCILIILGNSYFYTLRSPIQNLEVVQEWVQSSFFSFVLSADLVVDMFFWVSAFLASYQLLVKMRLNDGKLPSNKFVIIFSRFMRLWPLYAFTLLVFWRVMPLFGGEGPLFFEYENMNECSEHWVWHLTFLNNLLPWKAKDGCMQWTWYLACDMQFFIFVPFLVQNYFQNRQRFWVLTILIWSIASLFSVSVIIKNSLSASYFTYKDEYWTIFYEKPFARIPAYLIGIVWGCSYYTYKYEREEQDELFAGMTPDQIHRRRVQLNAEEEDPGSYQGIKYPKNVLVVLFNKLAVSKWGAIFVIICAILVKMILVTIVTGINAQPLEAMPFLNLIFLTFQRPLFVIAGGLGFAPIMLRNRFTYPITAFLEHSFWFPLARLSYGAYLSAGIFMLFRTFNMERGLWACEIDAFFMFMAYLSFAYLFSLVITVMVEKPCHNMFNTFILGHTEVYNRQASLLKGKGGATSSNKRSRLSDESSDAESLDTMEDSDNKESSFVSNSSNYKPRSELTLDSREVGDNTQPDHNSLISFPKPSKKTQEPPRETTDKKKVTKSVSQPLLKNDKKPAPQPSVSINKQPKKQVIQEERGKSSSAEDDGLYFLE